MAALDSSHYGTMPRCISNFKTESSHSALLLAVATMLAAAPALRIPYPILLVLGGLAIGLVPGMPEFELDPELVFFGVLLHFSMALPFSRRSAI